MKICLCLAKPSNSLAGHQPDDDSANLRLAKAYLLIMKWSLGGCRTYFRQHDAKGLICLDQ